MRRRPHRQYPPDMSQSGGYCCVCWQILWPSGKMQCIRYQDLLTATEQYLGRDTTKKQCSKVQVNVMTPCGFIPVPHGASVELIYLINNEICENQFHVTKGSNYSAADLVALRNTVNAWDASTWSTFRGNNAALVRIRTRALDSVGAPFDDFTLPTPRNGGQPSVALTNNVTFCIKKATGSAGRSFRGRWYMAGVSADFYGVDRNHVSLLAATNTVAALQTLVTTLSGAGHTLVVVSYRFNHLCRSVAVTTPVTSFVAVDLNLDSMRKRLAGRGHP